MSYVIRQAALEDLSFFIELAKEEGWNPGLEDSKAFYAADPKGFFIGELNGEKIGSISAVAYDAAFGFIGLYIVKSGYRGKGYGRPLWNQALHYLGKRAIGLDAVIKQEKTYKKSGFRSVYKSIRCEGKGGRPSSGHAMDLKQGSFEKLCEYDCSIFGVSRSDFLHHWIHASNARALGVLNGSYLAGYGVIRKCVQGYKIGPLFADHIDIAKELYANLCGSVGPSSVYLDVPQITCESGQIAQGLKPVFETVRMFRGTPIRQEIKKIFGITTFELG